MSSDNRLGGSVGARVARHLADATVHTRQKMLPAQRSLIALALEDFFGLVSAEIRATTGDLWTPLADAQDAPDWARKMFGFLARGSGQWQTFLAGNAMGAVMGGGLMDLLTNELAPVVHRLVAANPHAYLAPGDAARATALHIPGYTEGPGDAAGAGIDSHRFNTLVDLSLTLPAVGEVLTMVNRGLLSADAGAAALQRAGLHPRYIQSTLALRHAELTPEQLAALVNFGVIDEGAATPLAALTGMSTENFRRLVLGYGEPPSKEEMVFAFRRGLIDAATFHKGLQQGPLRNEWIPLVEQMTRVPMSVADAIESVVKGHMSPAEGEKIAGQNGLISQHWPILLAAAGNPPGAQAMLNWHNRGLMTLPEVTQGLRESRLNNKYIPLVISASEALPPMVTIRAMYAHRTIDRARALDLLGKHGYAVDIADALLAVADNQHHAKTRDLTVSEVVRLYTARRIDRTLAHDMLTALGFDAGEADLRLDLADVAREEKYVSAVVARLHSAYVKYLIDGTEVQGSLARIGIPGDAVTDLLNLWDIERSTVSKTLSEAQTIAALKSGHLVEREALGRLLGMGYGNRDAAILIDMALKRGV